MPDEPARTVVAEAGARLAGVTWKPDDQPASGDTDAMPPAPAAAAARPIRRDAADPLPMTAAEATPLDRGSTAPSEARWSEPAAAGAIAASAGPQQPALTISTLQQAVRTTASGRAGDRAPVPLRAGPPAAPAPTSGGVNDAISEALLAVGGRAGPGDQSGALSGDGQIAPSGERWGAHGPRPDADGDSELPPDGGLAAHAARTDFGAQAVGDGGRGAPAGNRPIGPRPLDGGFQAGPVLLAQPGSGPTGEPGPAIARAPDATAFAGPQPAQQVALQITRALGQDRTEIRIQLDPPDLGEVDIHLEFRELRLTATVSAERLDTHDLLQRDARLLARALREAGLELADADLSFAYNGREERPDAGPFAQRTIVLPPPAPVFEPLQAAGAARSEGFVSLADGRLDLRV